MNPQTPSEVHPITVALVEDDDFLRKDLERWLRGPNGFECVGSYRDGETTLPDILETKSDVVVLDFGLPGIKGDECTVLIKQRLPQVLVLIITGNPDDRVMFDALLAGADGFLEKSPRPPFFKQVEFLSQIKEMTSGGSPLSRRAGHFLMQQFQKVNSPRITDHELQLTQREREIGELLKDGLSDKEIGQRLHISTYTVWSHLKHLYAKLHARNRAEAAYKFWRIK